MAASQSIFGLTKDQLLPIVGTAVGTAVSSVDIAMQHPRPKPYGYQAEKQIPTFAYHTSSGDTGSITVFVKRFHRTGPAESLQYRFLSEHAAPIPRMYGASQDEDDHEVLFLEHVEVTRPIGTMLEMLSLIARFNAIQPSAEYGEWLQAASWSFDKRLDGILPDLETVCRTAADGALGSDLKEFCSPAACQRLNRAADRVLGLWRKSPQGLIHTDFSRENTGRRKPGELVVMDVEWTCLGPRFLDVAGWLGRSPEHWNREDDRLLERAQHYLDEYARFGGAPPSLAEFLDEIPAAWLLGEVRYLDWHMRRALGGWATAPADEDERRQCCEYLLRLLTWLLAEA